MHFFHITKGSGQVAAVDTRIKSETVTYVGWRDITPGDMRNYQYNVTLNGAPLFIGKNNPELTIDITNKPLFFAPHGWRGKICLQFKHLSCEAGSPG